VDWMTTADGWLALTTLTVMEIVLGIDNIIFISILAGKLPEIQRDRARLLGLSLAMFMRVALLLCINWIANLTNELFSIAGHEFSGRDLILLLGGFFLIYKATTEIHSKLEGEEEVTRTGQATSFSSVIVQIVLLDIVFSLDSVITAIGMANELAIMITAVVLAVFVMLFASGPISAFVHKHPTVKMLALSFLLLIGVTLVAEGWGAHIDKAYIYFAMAFSVFVEMLNLRLRPRVEPVHLHEQIPSGPAGAEPAS
jgi:predicted tellurium resistance membrane protein TerC